MKDCDRDSTRVLAEMMQQCFSRSFWVDCEEYLSGNIVLHGENEKTNQPTSVYM